MKQSPDYKDLARPERIFELVKALAIIGINSEKRNKYQVWAINLIAAASSSSDYELVAKAATILHKIHTGELEAKEIKMLSAIGVASDIASTPGKYGLKTKPSKATIIEIIQAQRPDLMKVIPTSKRGLTDWWKLVGCDVEQARGYINAEVRKLINQ
jgi:hypothetical protein